MLCINCGKKLTGRRRKYCSHKCLYKVYYRSKDNLKKNSVNARRSQVKKKFKLSLEEYNVLTQICCVEGCYWKWCINLHHLDGDKNNNSLDNLVPLCFNHHILLHGAAIKFEELENYSAGGDKL